jgi:hypothetical protein
MGKIVIWGENGLFFLVKNFLKMRKANIKLVFENNNKTYKTL